MRIAARSLAGFAILGLLAGCMATPDTTEPAALSQLGRSVDILMIGEIHGTVETPAAFGDLVERAARQQRLTVGLELSDRTIAGAGCGAARPVEGTEWLDPVQDGRTSRAMRALVCRLAALQARGRIDLFGFSSDARTPPGETPYAEAVLSRARSRRSPMMLLVGNYHARRRAGSLAQALSEARLRLVTVTVSYPTGTAFTCDEKMKCGPREVPANFCAAAASAPALLVGAPAGLPPQLPWDGCLILPRTTASPPA